MSSKAMAIGGCAVMENFLTTALCTELLARVNDYRSRHTIPVIERYSES